MSDEDLTTLGPPPPSGTARLTFRPLAEDDAPRVQRVYERTPGFFRRLGLETVPPDAAERDLLSEPPEPWDDLLYYLGIALRGSDELIGVVYLARAYPRPDVLWVSFLLIAEDQQRRGYGREVVAALETWVETMPEISAIGLAVDPNNEPCLAFWRALGYRPRDWSRSRPSDDATVGLVKRLKR
jgi:RimJ/RimL family protein N-acetyltransferase